MSDQIYGDRIKQARTLRQLTSTSLAEALDVTPSTITRWEAAEQLTMEPGRVDKLSSFLRFPNAFFEALPSDPVVDDDLLFRAPKSTAKREKAYLREFARLAGEVLAWVEERRALPPLTLPTDGEGSDVVGAAQAARRALGHSSDSPIQSLTHAVERAGVPVLRRPMKIYDGESRGTNTEKHLGYTTWVGDFWDRPIVITRAVPSWERTRWTVAHEVGHIVLHHRRAKTYDGATAEDEANWFANELLAPVAVLREELPAVITLFSLLDAKAKWGISLGALTTHLYVNRIISQERRETLRAQLYARHNPETGTTYGVYEPGWKDREPEQPSMLRFWLERTVGTTRPEAIAAMSGQWPADLLAEMLVEQQARTVLPKSQGQAAEVVSLASRRSRHNPPNGEAGARTAGR